MHIAVNCLLLYGTFSGVQYATIHQLRALLNQDSAHQYSLVALHGVDIAAIIGPTKLPYQLLRAPLRAGQRGKRIIWEQLSLPKLLQQHKVDLLYSPGYLTSLRWQGASLVFIHDTIALSHPQLCTFSNALNYRILLPPSAQHASHIAVPSNCSAQDVLKYCRVKPEKISVVPLGVDIPPTPTIDEMAKARLRLASTAPFLLALGIIEPKKNYSQLIRWFDNWAAAGLPHSLVIIGKYGWKSAPFRQALRNSRFRERIIMPGYIPQDELPALIAAADLLMMPSLYEGFGLPALEAMAVGTPVAVSDQGALPETVAQAGLVLPLVDKSWQEEIPILLANPERLAALRIAGLAHAHAMSWQKSGEQLVKVLELTAKNYQQSS